MSRARRTDAETAELARRRLEAVLRPRRALATPEPGLGAGAGSDRGPDPDDEPEEEVDLPTFADLDRDPAARSSRAPVGAPRLADRALDFTRGHLGVVLVLAVVALLVAAAGVARARPLTLSEPDPTPLTVASGSASSAPVVSPVPSPSATGPSPTGGGAGPGSASAAPGLVVHVTGVVRHPGLVRLAAGARVADAIAAAGGLGSGAAPGELNLAQPLRDGQQLVIVSRAATQRDPPERSEVRDPGTGSGSGTASSGTSSAAGSPPPGGKVDLNTATVDQLDALSGVGPVTARRILDWRSAHGRFSRIEELQEVDGIGPKTFAELAPQVTV